MCDMKNTILDLIRKTYSVHERFTTSPCYEKNAYDVYDNVNCLKYVFSVKCEPKKKDCVFYNGEAYDNVNDLYDAVARYNKTLTFPAWCYDPNFVTWANTESKINWYLRQKLNLERSFENELYFFKTAFGEKLIEVRFEVNMDNGNTGYVSVFLNGLDSAIHASFESAEDAVTKLNSLIAGIIIEKYDKGLELLDNLAFGFNNVKQAEVMSVDSIMSGRKVMYKDRLLPVLKRLLTAIESE